MNSSAKILDENKLEWKDLLSAEKKLPYFQELLTKISKFRESGKTIYPANSNVFRAFAVTPLDQLSIVILGQDPYHGAGQAHGLSFSVQEGVAQPPSLQNIYKEIQSDLGIARPQSGDLTRWAEQGVLLLNSVLTVEADKAASHSGMGWERFTDSVISLINEHRTNIVFMLWGSYAQKKGACIDTSRNLVLHAPHPSPLSAHRGFLGCHHFSKANQYLLSVGKQPIRW